MIGATGGGGGEGGVGGEGGRRGGEERGGRERGEGVQTAQQRGRGSTSAADPNPSPAVVPSRKRLVVAPHGGSMRHCRSGVVEPQKETEAVVVVVTPCSSSPVQKCKGLLRTLGRPMYFKSSRHL